jgi:cytochrome c oxidase assembly protein subunit 15
MSITMQSPLSRGSAASGHIALQVWLWAVAMLVFVIIAVGGATRLTGSGLSITEWQPIMGAIPPLSDADWQAAFDKYRQIAQYKLVNKGMSLDAFKEIFWWEWGHRQLARAIGVAFAVPFAVFWWLGMIPRRLKARLVGVLALGALQGGIGWYMVQSGLVDRVAVSHYRLALHLSVAMVIFAALVWLALSLGPDQRRRIRLRTLPPRTAAIASTIIALVFLQTALGAFVAGTKAGLSHNTWPLMDGRLIPSGLFAMSPWWINAFENVATIQFNHRMIAYVLLAVTGWHVWRVVHAADDERVRVSALLLAIGMLLQAVFGIWTLLAMVPLWLGLVHQGGAAIVLGLAVWHRYTIANT